jgi:DNA-binding HxlR family transcriptional regulator
MEEVKFRSDCPINFALELLGDKWSLLIIRDIALSGKTSYGQFLSSDEKIATNVLSNRLAMLEKANIISKRLDQNNKTKYIYSLTRHGFDLIPLLVEIIVWTDSVKPVTGQRKLVVERAKTNKQQLINDIQAHLKAGSAQPFELLLSGSV